MASPYKLLAMMNLSSRAHPLATKAWKVSNDDEGESHIVWCDHGMQARRLGAQGLERDFDEVECQRYPQLDGFTGDLLGWMLEAGWSFECWECYKRTGLEYEGFVRDPDDDLFCSATCAAKHHAYWAAKKKLEREFQRFAEVKYFGLGPEVRYVNAGEEALVYLHPPESSTLRDCKFISRAELGALPP